MASWGGNTDLGGSGLNGPSRTKIVEIARLMFTIEALAEGPK